MLYRITALPAKPVSFFSGTRWNRKIVSQPSHPAAARWRQCGIERATSGTSRGIDSKNFIKACCSSWRKWHGDMASGSREEGKLGQHIVGTCWQQLNRWNGHHVVYFKKAVSNMQWLHYQLGILGIHACNWNWQWSWETCIKVCKISLKKSGFLKINDLCPSCQSYQGNAILVKSWANCGSCPWRRTSSQRVLGAQWAMANTELSAVAIGRKIQSSDKWSEYMNMICFQEIVLKPMISTQHLIW